MPPKQKGKKMDLGSFLHDAESGGAWSDDIDLPTAPVASFSNPSNDYSSADRMNSSSSLRREEKYSNAPVDLESIPFDPPFTAYIGNLAFDATEHDLETFFGSDIKVKSVRFIMDIQTNRPKGYGYVEFIDRESLVEAIKMNGESLHKRNVRINVAEQKSRPARPGHDDSKFQGNWRTRSTEAKPAGAFKSGFGNREREDRPHTGGWASGFQRNTDRNPFQKRSNDNESAAAPAAPREPAKPKANPFGNATPRDELAIQKEIEERRLAREKERDEEAKQTKKVQEAEKALEKANISNKPKRDHDRPPPPPDNVPSGAGSWRRAAGSKPPQGARPAAFRKGSGDKGSLNSISTDGTSSAYRSSNQKKGFEKNGDKFQKKENSDKFQKKVPSPTTQSEKSPSVVSPKNPFEMLGENNE